jgi:RHS repeat-associated protein
VQSVSLASFNLDDWLSPETYDANGNTTYTGGKTFAYDSENHLVSMNGGAVTMIYDGFGNRVAKTVGNVTTKYLVEDDVNPTGLPQVFEESVNGVVQRTYTYGLQRISENQQINGTWTPSFYGYDGMGSVRQLTGLDEKVTDTYNYDAFGNLLSSPGPTPNNYLYRGEQYDSELALYYLRARYYNPQTGRFLSRDPKDYKSLDSNGLPLDPKRLHKYLYADGDPVNGRDPRGLEDLIDTSEVNSNNLKVIFGHGFRHLFGTGLSQAEVETEIEAAIQEAYADEGLESCADTGIIAVQGIPIVYRMYVIDAVNLICNVGTYFPL